MRLTPWTIKPTPDGYWHVRRVGITRSGITTFGPNVERVCGTKEQAGELCRLLNEELQCQKQDQPSKAGPSSS